MARDDAVRPLGVALGKLPAGAPALIRAGEVVGPAIAVLPPSAGPDHDGPSLILRLRLEGESIVGGGSSASAPVLLAPL